MFAKFPILPRPTQRFARSPLKLFSTVSETGLTHPHGAGAFSTSPSVRARLVIKRVVCIYRFPCASRVRP